MDLIFLVIIIVIIFIIFENCHEGYQNYVSNPDKICDHPEEKWYYVFVNEDILKSPRMESYNSYSKNKDMYSSLICKYFVFNTKLPFGYFE